MTGSSAEGGPEGLDHDLRDLLDQQRRQDAADGRRRRHWLARQAGEAGTLAGVLVDLGERDQPVTVTTGPGRHLTGVVRTLGVDFLGLRSVGGSGTLVALAAVTGVRPEPGAVTTLGDRLVEVDVRLQEVLAPLAAERPWVSLHTRSGDVVAGTLRSVGLDVLALAPGTDRSVTYVPLAAVSDLVLP